MSAVRLVPCSSAALWNRLIQEVAGGTAFHEWDFLDLQERMLGVRVERLLVMRADRPVGVVPLARRGRLGLRAPWLPFPLLGPALPSGSLLPVLRAVRRRQRRSGLVLARFDVAPDLALAASAAAVRTRMRVRPDGTVHVDLSHRSAERLDAGMSRTRRKTVRRALHAGLAAGAARPGETAALLGRVLEAAYARHGAETPYPPDVGQQVEEWAVGRDDVRLGVVRVGDEAVGSLVTLAGHPRAASWIGSVLPAARETGGETLLLRDAMLWAMGRGCTGWEFGGRVDDEVERFKRSFGGAAVPYVTVESFLGPFAVRRVLGRL